MPMAAGRERRGYLEILGLVADSMCPGFLDWASRWISGELCIKWRRAPLRGAGPRKRWSLCTFLEDLRDYPSYNMWLIFRDTPRPELQLLLQRAWLSASLSPWLWKKTVEPCWVATGILDYVLGWPPFFQPELRWAKKELMLRWCWNFALHPVPKLRVLGPRAPVILIQREVLDFMTPSPGEKQEAYWALDHSWVHIISRVELGGFGRAERECGAWESYTYIFRSFSKDWFSGDKLPWAGSDSPRPVSNLESTNHPLLQENNENGDLKC